MRKINKIALSIVLIGLVGTALSMVTGVSLTIIATVLLAIGFVKGLFNLSMPFESGILRADGFSITDTTYAGEAASSFIVKAITSNETVQGGHVYIQDGIKKKFTIPRFDADYTDFIQDRQAQPISKGTMTADAKTLLPVDYMIYTEFNPRDYEAHWFATQLNDKLIDTKLPVSVESLVIQEVMKRHNRYFNRSLWVNSTLLASATSIFRYYDGFLRKASTGSGALLPASPTTLTNANIVTEVQKGYALIPAALKYDPSMKIFCSYSTYDLFCQYQINQASKGVDITQMGMGTYRGLPMVKIPDFPDDTYVMARGMASPESNLWVGMNSTDDNTILMDKVNNSGELWFLKVLMKSDVAIGWNEECVYYGPTVATNL